MEGSVVIFGLIAILVVYAAQRYYNHRQARKAWESLSFDERTEIDFNNRERQKRNELTHRLHATVSEILQIPCGIFDIYNSRVIKDYGFQKVKAADTVQIYTTPVVEVEGQLFMLLDGKSSWGLQRVKQTVDTSGLVTYQALPGDIYHLGDLYRLKEKTA